MPDVNKVSRGAALARVCVMLAALPLAARAAANAADTAEAAGKTRLAHAAALARTALMSKSLATVARYATRIAADLRKME